MAGTEPPHTAEHEYRIWRTWWDEGHEFAEVLCLYSPGEARGAHKQLAEFHWVKAGWTRASVSPVQIMQRSTREWSPRGPLHGTHTVRDDDHMTTPPKRG